MKIVRVTLNEYELENGSIHPIEPPLEKIMTPKQFQEHYDKAIKCIESCNPFGC